MVSDHMASAARAARRQGHGPLQSRRFDLCAGMDFKYSSIDWDVIPGLRQSEHDPDGHHAPVFFDRRALLKYVVRPEYAVRRFKDGGIVRFANGADLKYGITRAGRMVCWLGELDRIPEREQHYMLSDNLESDHDVVSWLYRDRLGLPAEPTAEQQLVEAFLQAIRRVREELKCDVWVLRDKEIQALHAIERPVVWNEYVSYNINRLYRVILDTIDLARLTAKLKELGIKPTHENSGISCLKDFLESRFGSKDSLDFKPFHTLRDWRHSLDHASPGLKGEAPDWKLMRLAPPNHMYEEAYDEMLKGLTGAFQHMAGLP